MAIEEQARKHKISNTNSNFYRFKGNQEQLGSVEERPKSSKGGVRTSGTTI